MSGPPIGGRATNFAKFVAAPLAALCLPLSAAAQSLRDCDTPEANARNLALPVETAVRSFANGAITLIALDTDEPACCSGHLMVLHPSGDGYLACTLISREGVSGFAATFVGETAGRYDPARGLTLDVPVLIHLPEEGFTNSGLVHITVNQAVGSVAADFTPGGAE